MRVICPEQDSLFPQNNNAEVIGHYKKSEKCGVIFDGFQLVGDDFNSDQQQKMRRQLGKCLHNPFTKLSPIHSGENFAPIPLYKQLKNQPHLTQDLIKWQEIWQACDQLQMNGAVLEQSWQKFPIIKVRFQNTDDI